MMINSHTEKLVKEEIDYWQDIDKTGAEVYIEEMQKILEEINSEIVKDHDSSTNALLNYYLKNKK